MGSRVFEEAGLIAKFWRLGVALAVLGAAPVWAQSNESARTVVAFERLKSQPVRLSMFLRAMPKGGDLHNHIDGAVYAESFLSWAVADKLCVDKKDLSIVVPPCAGNGVIPAASALADKDLYVRLVDAMSMKDFIPSAAESGHDHFFASFDKYEAASAKRAAAMLAEVADRAGAENVSYLELMWSPGMFQASAEAQKLGAWDGNAAGARAKLEKQFQPIVGQSITFFNNAEAGMRKLLRCGTPQASPGCRVTIRYQAQVIRTQPTIGVFGEILYGYMLASKDHRVVAENLVAPEDDPVALRDYDAHMHMLQTVEGWYPGVRLSLHAGELTDGLVPPEDLRFHIREAVEVANANRIGHGVDIMYEDDAAQLLQELAIRKVLVEINLTSNDVILGVKGDQHPFMTYRAYGVPVALSTDDEGVSRIDLTHEYVRAVETYPLSYGDLKEMVRNSIEYSFASGASLWQSVKPYRLAAECGGADVTQPPAGACADLIARSDKARLEWDLEDRFKKFEALGW